MPTKSCQQEILLSFNSGFLSMICPDKSKTEPKRQLLDVEKIEEACWNGLLKELFPEICSMTSSGKQMFIWGIRDYNTVMEIDIGEYPSAKDDYLGIDPYKFMATREKKLHS
jgi:hypothetical protein